MDKKLYLSKTAKNDFCKFCIQKINKYNIKNITNNMINKYFDYCIKKETFTTLTGYNKIAGEVSTASINKIFLDNGEILDNYSEILKYNTNEYNKNNYNYICDNLFNDMFCNLEWLNRSKNDYDYSKKLYNKIFIN